MRVRVVTSRFLERIAGSGILTPVNPYGIFILAMLLLAFVLEAVADVLNLRALQTRPPAGFEGVYEEEAYRRSQDYTRAGTRFGLLVSTLGLLATLAFWFAGGFAYVDELVRGLGQGTVLTGLLYIGALTLLSSLLGLPFRLYSTFVIEERFGFNRTTLKTFFLDGLKGLALAVVLGGPLLAVVLVFFERAGEWAWVYCWGAAGAFVVVLQLVVPTWILPIFNKFEPLARGELRDALEAYSRSVGFPLSGIFVVDGSRRSTKSNAFLAGFGRAKRIALFDTLIDKHTVPELVAVLAHEVGHYKCRHVLKGTLIALLHLGVMFALLSVFITREGLFEAFYVEQVSIYAGFVFFGLLYTPVELVLSLILNTISRRHELEADHFAATTIDDRNAMIEALKKLSVDNLSNLTPHPFYVLLHYSHPPLRHRVEAIAAEVSG